MNDNKNNVPSSKVMCSCGETQIIKWSDTAGEYVAQLSYWRFKLDAPAGWYCGIEGHYQHSVVDMPIMELEPPAKNPISEWDWSGPPGLAKNRNRKRQGR